MNVGDKVWYTMPRYSTIYEGIISKIGRKYFYVLRWGTDKDPYKVNLATMRDETNCGYGYRIRVYLSKQEILDEGEYNKLWSSLAGFFARYHNGNTLSLETLREIAKLAGIEGDAK